MPETTASRQAPPRLTVLLATFNRRDLLPAVLEPLFADPSADEIVVVDDGSTDGSIELLEQLAIEHPRLVPMRVDNGGAAKALLAGARRARGELLVIIDDDEIVDPGSVTGHLRTHGDRRDLVVVGFIDMNWPVRRTRGDYARYRYAAAYELDCRRWEHGDDILANLWGGYISMTRENFLRAMSSESALVDGYHYDLDFGARCLELGLRAEFHRSLRALHLYERDGPASLRDAHSSGRNRILVHRAHPSVLPALGPDFVEQRSSRTRAAVVRLAFSHRSVHTALRLGLTLAGLARWWYLETGLAGLLWDVEQKRGALEVLDRLPAPSVTRAH